ncbi:MAG TPA: helix-turn-helix transcriptional regulator [Humibacter sp.]|nr:helix-turn-helix transcriptional regulator [Humibacter sp.]
MAAIQKTAGAGTGRLLTEQMEYQRISIRELASRAGCDDRTVQRAIRGETTPKTRIAQDIAAVLGVAPEDLWPRFGIRHAIDAATIEVRLFPSRAQVPVDLWREMFEAATEQIDICVYGGTFLFDALHGFTRIIHAATERGTKVRFAVGDPDSDGVRQRGGEERIGDALAARCKMTLVHLEPLNEVEGVEIRTHGTPLYTSTFFIDDMLYANHHILGSPAGDNPVIELHREASPELWDSYAVAFDAVWSSARPARYPLES